MEELIRLYLDNAPEEYIQAILYGYRGVISSSKYSVYNSKYLPNKGDQKPVNYILSLADLKICNKCKKILDIEDFNYNNAKIDIWLLSTIPYFSYYRFDNKSVIALYSHSKEGRWPGDVPVIVCKSEGTYFDYFYNQFDSIINNSQLSKKIT